MKYLLFLIPLLGSGQAITKYTYTLTPEVVEGQLQYKASELEESPTIITFHKHSLEISNYKLDITIFTDRTVGNSIATGRTRDGQVALIQLISMKSVTGKKMTVLRLSYDKEYLFFPEKPWIK